MKKVKLILMCIAFSATVMAADKVIQLPKPNMNRNTSSVMKALSERKSTREYASRPLSMADLSDLLWAANGFNRPAESKRTAPSARNVQDVDVYVILPQGTYLYNAKDDRLELVAAGDHRAVVAGPQEFAKNAPVSLLLVSNLDKLGNTTSKGTQLMGAVDVGIVSQNISIFCSAVNMGTVPRGTMDVNKLKTILKLKDSQLPLINHPVGYMK